MRAWLVVAVVACAKPQPPGWPAPRGTMHEPGADYYRGVWLRLAAEANEVSPEAFARIVHVDSSTLTCPQDCLLEVHYTFHVDWLAIEEKDYFFVHDHPRTGTWPAPDDARWYSEDEIRAAHDIGHIESHTATSAALKLAFSSRDDAVAEFVRLFGHEPAQRLGWAYSYGKGMPSWEHPSLEYDAPADHCSGQHVLDLVTGHPHHERDEICIDRVSAKP
jgi:hypothetical protein